MIFFSLQNQILNKKRVKKQNSSNNNNNKQQFYNKIRAATEQKWVSLCVLINNKKKNLTSPVQWVEVVGCCFLRFQYLCGERLSRERLKSENRKAFE